MIVVMIQTKKNGPRVPSVVLFFFREQVRRYGDVLDMQDTLCLFDCLHGEFETIVQ